MRTITLEEHISTPEFLEATDKLWVGDPAVNFWKANRTKLLDCGNGRIADMDAAGIDMQVLSLSGIGMERLDVSTAAALARDTNDKLAVAVQAHPARFTAFATLVLTGSGGPGVRALRPATGIQRRPRERNLRRSVSRPSALYAAL